MAWGRDWALQPQPKENMRRKGEPKEERNLAELKVQDTTVGNGDDEALEPVHIPPPRAVLEKAFLCDTSPTRRFTQTVNLALMGLRRNLPPTHMLDNCVSM